MRVAKLVLGGLFGLATVNGAIGLGSNALASDFSTLGITRFAASCAATVILGLITVLFFRSALSKQRHDSVADD